jgi:flagellar export protein FliJ
MTGRFHLQPLLNHKRRLEEIQQQRLAKIRQQHHREANALEGLELEVADQLSSLTSAQVGPVDAAGVQRRLAYLEQLRNDRARQGEVVERLEGDVAEGREQLVSILKEKKTLERLEERAREKAAREERRREALQAGEISMARFARRRRTEAS